MMPATPHSGPEDLGRLLEAALDRESVGVALMRLPDLTYVYVNPVFQALAPAKRMVGRTYYQVWPELGESAWLNVRRVAQSGEPWVVRDMPWELEREAGAPPETVYLTFEFARIEVSGMRYLLSLHAETTAEVDAREKLAESRLELDRVRERAELLQEVSAAGASGLTLEQTAARVLSALRGHLGPLSGLVAVEEEGEQRVLASIGPPPGDAEGSAALARRAVREQRVLTHEDDETAPAGVRRLVAPLEYGAQVLGVLEAEWEGTGPFSAEELELARAIAGTLAQAVEDARLFDAEARARRRAQEELRATEVLLQAADAFNSLDLGEVMQSFADSLLRVTGCDRVTLQRYEPERDELVVWGVVTGERIEHSVRLPVATLSPEFRAVLEQRRSAVIDYESPDVSEAAREEGRTYGLRHALLVPMLVGDRLVGVVGVDECGGRHEFEEREIALMEGIVTQAAVAIENARLYEETRETALLNETLNDIDAEINATLDVEALIDHMLGAAIGALGVDSASLVRLVEGGWVTTHTIGLPQELIGKQLPLEDVPHGTAAVKQQQVLPIEDAFNDPRTNPSTQRRLGVRSVLVAPLTRGDESFGVMFFNHMERMHAFTVPQVDFATKLAAHVSLALHNAQLFHSEEQRGARARALHDVTDLAISSMEPAEVAERALGYITARLGVDVAAVWLADEKREHLKPLAGTGFAHEVFANHPPVPLDGDWEAARAYRQVRTLSSTVEEMPAEIREGYARMEFSLATSMSLPIRGRDRVVGTLRLSWNESQQFCEDDVTFYESLAAELGGALLNAKQYQEERERGRLGEALDELNRVVHATLEPSEVLQRALEAGAQALDVPKGLVLRREDGSWAIRHQHGYDQDLSAARFTRPPELAATETTGEPIVLHAMGESPGNSHDTFAQWGITAALVVPLYHHGQVDATISLNRTEPGADFTEAEVDFVRRLGAAVSLALENTALYEREREAALLNERLSQIDATLHSTLEFDEVAQRALEEGANAVGADSAALSMREPAGFRVAYVCGMPDATLGEVVPDEYEAHALIALRTCQPVAVDDVETDERVSREHLREHGIRSIVVAPLIIKNEPVGVVCYNFTLEPHHFTDTEVAFVSRVASSLSLALENAQLYAGERHIAQTLQRALLALPSEVPGIEFAHAYHSATHSTRVGGDFYDVFELDHGLLGLLVGDVSGKGLDAAVLTALVKNTVRAHAMVKGNTPSDVMRRVNEVLLKESRTETFVTAWFGMLDRRDGRLVYCSAGHPAAVVIRAGAEVARLAPNSPLVGAFEGAQYVDSEGHLAVDETLFLYTDGLTESRQDGRMYGEARLMVELARCTRYEPVETIEHVLADVLAYAGGRLSDDVAVLAVRRTELPAEMPVQQKFALWADA